MRKLLTLLAILISVQAVFGDVRLIMVDGFCYLEGQSEHSETKVKFIKVSPSAITDSTYTDSSGYFFITDLYEGIYDVEYTHSCFNTVVVGHQVILSNTTLSPLYLDLSLAEVSGYCYLEGQSSHLGTKVKFSKVSACAVTDSTYTNASGYFFITDLRGGIYDVEYTHSWFDTVILGDQVILVSSYLPPVTLPCPWSTLWGSLSGTLAPSSYHVIDAISVNSGDSLRLPPGTTFIFEGPYPFRIYGTLLADGVEGDSIVLTTDTLANPGGWGGLRFSGTASSGSRLAYCLIESGFASGNWPDCAGGGVCCLDGSSPTFTNCTIRGNRAYYYYGSLGGGVYCQSSSPAFTNCMISDNSTDYYGSGGGVCCQSSSPTFTNCTFSGNLARQGGGVYCVGSGPIFRCCTLRGNSAIWGGGVYCNVSLATFSSSIIAFSIGSGICFGNSSGSQIVYCDIFGNTGGNITFAGNDPNQGPPAIGWFLVTNANADSADIYMNIFVDPLFVDTAAGDYHLTDFSHCIGAGDPADTVSTDFEGDPRPNPSWSFPDIGADEHWSGSPVLHLVVSIADANAVLHWTPFGAGPYYIYGATTPFAAGTLLDTVSETTTWTDEETANRPSRYSYYVMAEWPGR